MPTEDAVRECLELLRQAKPLAGSTLIAMHTLRRRIRARGDVIGGEALEWELAELLTTAIRDGLARARGGAGLNDSSAVPRDRVIEAMREDFAVGSTEREAWSTLYHRFVAPGGWRMREIAATVRPHQATATRQLRRRLAQGVGALAVELRRLEREAEMAEAPGRALPTHLTAFVGRSDEVAAIADLVSRRRAVTLTGPGGIGKSRLALEAAAAAAGRFADGVRVVDLGAVDDPSTVAQALASALGVEPGGGSLIADVARGRLADRQMLLVVDNCEHVSGTCGMLADGLLRKCPALVLLATSLEPLRVPGEAVVPVGPLGHGAPSEGSGGEPDATSDAVRLFVDRARAAIPGFEPARDDIATIALVCQRLDGIPLAIELAAPLLRALTPEQLAERLADRYAVLRSGRRAARPQHQALQDTIAWSYALLDDREQALLRRLSVCRGGWTMEAAEAMATGGRVRRADVVGLLASLAEKGLVVTRDEGGRRFHMLETVRCFAEMELARHGETEMARDAHCTYFVELEAGSHHATAAGVAPEAMTGLEQDNVAAARARGDARPAGGPETAGRTALTHAAAVPPTGPAIELTYRL